MYKPDHEVDSVGGRPLFLTVSLSNSVILDAILTQSPTRSRSHYHTLSLSHPLTLTLSLYLSLSLDYAHN